jgi:hypothetical protein
MEALHLKRVAKSPAAPRLALVELGLLELAARGRTSSECRLVLNSPFYI